ncbi:MAG: hypothetical protein E7345_03010 [Clostridiales bacterium]|nr:hypothetical protein [Clostridiales bacterium]
MEENMILRDLPVHTRNYTIIDNVTGKPIDQENYSLTIDKEVISKLNKLKEVNEEKKRQASLKGQYADITLVDTFTPDDNAVFTPIYSGEYIDAQDFVDKPEEVPQEITAPVEEEVKVSAELIKQDKLLDRVVAREGGAPAEEEQPEVPKITDIPEMEGGLASKLENKEETPVAPAQDNSVFTPEDNSLKSASEQIVNIDADKLGKEIKAPKGFKEGREIIKLDKMEIRQGKGIAWMAYILFFIPLLMKKTNRFVRLHANEGLELNIMELLAVILMAPYFLMKTATGTLLTVITIASLVGFVLLVACALTIIPMILGAMFGKTFQNPWLWKKRIIKVSTERP